jgi:type I restriction-modification system DNA methylase subunit
MSNRINGDFDSDSIEAFRAAYAAQILEPEDQETDQYTGLPTNLILNTSPWLQHTGLWKANDGTNKDFQPNQVLVPGLGELAEESEYDELDDLSEEELEELVEQLLADEGDDDLSYYEENENEDEDELSDEEIERLIEELLSEEEDEEADEPEITDEEIDALIAEIETESEELNYDPEED